MHIRVVSKRKDGTAASADETIVYIGRPSVLGNPFTMRDESQRASVIARYKTWLEQRYLDDPAVHAELHALAARAKAGEQLALQCWCAPAACHGDVIINALRWIIRQSA